MKKLILLFTLVCITIAAIGQGNAGTKIRRGFNVGNPSANMLDTDSIKFNATLDRLVFYTASGVFEVNLQADSIDIDTVAHMMVDTLQFVGGWGDGSDSTGNSDALYMGMFSVAQDSIVFDSVSVKCHGLGGDITVKWMYSVDWPLAGVEIHAEVNATHALGWTGEDTFDPLALGLGNYIWLERISGGGCQALRSILYYHEKRAL